MLSGKGSASGTEDHRFKSHQGPMLWFFKYFRQKNRRKNYSERSSIMQNFDHNIGFWEKRQFFAENWQKSQKIVIITSTPRRKVFGTRTFQCILTWKGYGFNNGDSHCACQKSGSLFDSWFLARWEKVYSRSGLPDGTFSDQKSQFG
jgi:hypothetical protein